jgi:hypothetical protein
VHVAQQDGSSGTALATEEEFVLRCLGVAIIMQWNALPTTLRREIFRHRRVGRQVIGDGGAPRANRPISAQAQG